MTTAALTITQPSSPDPVNDPSAFIREAFVTLAAAFPSARSDETYWTLLARTFSDTPDYLLTAAVMAYIRETTYHVLPPLGRLIQLVEKAKSDLEDRARERADQIGFTYVELTERRKTALIQAIPVADRVTVARLLDHVFQATPDYLQALSLIGQVLDLSHAIDLGQGEGYSPTGLMTDSLTPTAAEYEARFNKPVRSTAAYRSADLSAYPLPEDLQGLSLPYRVSLPRSAYYLTAYVTEAEAFDEWSRTEGL